MGEISEAVVEQLMETYPSMKYLALQTLPDFIELVETKIDKTTRPTVGDMVRIIYSGRVGRITKDSKNKRPFQVSGVDGFYHETDVEMECNFVSGIAAALTVVYKTISAQDARDNSGT